MQYTTIRSEGKTADLGAGEVGQIALCHRHALGLSRRAGGIEEVGKLVRPGRTLALIGRVLCTFSRNGWRVPIKANQRAMWIGRTVRQQSRFRQARHELLLREQQGDVGILHHKGQALLRIVCIQRQIGGPRFENCQQPDHHL